MSLLFEAIKVQNGKFYNIKYHNERFNKARKELFGCKDFIDLKIKIKIPASKTKGLYKCRIVYGPEIEKIEFIPYKKPNIRSLKITECNDIDYKYKYLDRTKIDELLKQKGEYDDILLIKNGFITDTSIANICFYDGEKWITPNTPLLKGTKRQKLLDEGKITEQKITRKDLRKFKKASLINAMNDLFEIEINL
ncbi:aminotransferase class IV [Candidatus Peregrinibacteria bacterium]|nr:aminotransferase class IV [Candidatus Peregrinibacteria bacterium]